MKFHLIDAKIPKPDLIIYLKAETDTLISRINNRNRNFEKEIDIEYLHSLNILYDKWINKISDHNIYIIETDGFNIFKDDKKLDGFIFDIHKILT